MKNLPSKEQRCVDAAEGWLGLGNWREANEEIENITPQFRAHPFVLEMRYKIYSAADRWDMAVDVAMGLREILPDNQWGHFYTAYALHELKLTQDAYNTLKPVLEKFPDHFLMRYNLACYSCRLGKLKESLMWLAIRINPVQQPSKMSWVSLPKHNASHEQTALIARYIHESPFAAYCLAPWKMTTDFVSTEDFHKTDLHRLALGPIGVNHQILSGLGVREDRAYSAVLNRTHHGFSEHERDILDAVQPHLVTSFINAAAHGHASKAINQTQTALESAPGGYAYFNGEGQLVWIQARAKAWLNEFFEGEHLPDGGVPTAIRQLLQQSALNKDEVQIFECDGAAELLTAWFDSAELGGRVLRLERKPKTQAPHFRPLPQLSERKNEVLKWMVEGKRNAEIAAILGLSARTVENHVLEILRDMMVENRATAIVQAMDYCVAINNGKTIVI